MTVEFARLLILQKARAALTRRELSPDAVHAAMMQIKEELRSTLIDAERKGVLYNLPDDFGLTVEPLPDGRWHLIVEDAPFDPLKSN